MRPLPDPERWRRIAPLLEEALELPPEERASFLQGASGEDPGLRAEIEALLAADSDAGEFLGAPVDLSAMAPGPGGDSEILPDGAGASALAGQLIGPYRVVREIGRGGMGVVYEAEQQRPRRPVALKVILGGRYVDAETICMFQRESDSLARLKHPSIASIYESGCTEEGQHFFAMELVQGRTLSAYLGEAGAPASRRDLRLRLALFRKIASAVAYAHQRGVIHRDLKPSNILVLEADETGPPAGQGAGRASHGAEGNPPGIKILDFGLARIADPGAESAPTVSVRGSVRGTLAYMSPEQVRGRSDEIDVRADVYALGVLLYQLLSGRLPYDLERAGITEAVRIICEQAPRPLGAPAGGGPRIDRDLAIIVQKALEKEPARRYQTAASLDEEIGRFLNGQPILARPPGAAYQIRKLIARHKTTFALAAAASLILPAFAIVTAVEARRIAAERDRANREAETALRVSSFLTDLFKVSAPNEAKGNAIKAREILDKGVEKIGKELSDEPLVQARLMLTMGNVYWDLGLYREAEPILQQSLATRKRLLGEEDLDTLASMDGLAFLYQQEGRAAESEKLYARSLELRLRLQGEQDSGTLKTMSGLAWVYRKQARYAEAEKLYRRVLEARRRAQGEDDPNTLLSAADLADCLWILRRYAEAEVLYLSTLDRMRRALGEEHTYTLGAMHGLADVYAAEGRNADAEKLYRTTLDGMRRILGEAHPMTLSTMNDFAGLLDHQKRYAEAETIDRQVLETRRRVLGDDHPETLTSLGNLANKLSMEGRHAEAEALLREELGRERRLLGENHPNTLNTLYNLACNAALAGDRAGALSWLRQAVDHGLSDADMIERDSDLKSLRRDPAFEALIARAREAAKRAGAK
jgi:eukaryotic-like serine/threonine-protein kinase